MAATEVYVDGLLGAGANDGTSWGDAYQGAVGFQTALDNVVLAARTRINIKRTFTLVAALDVDAAGGDPGTNTWLRIIGWNDAGDAELTKGNYVEVNAGTGAFDCFDITGVENVEWRHIHATRDDAGESADELGWDIRPASVKYNFLLNNCKASNVYHGIKTDGNCRSLVMINCIFEDTTSRALNHDGGYYGGVFVGCIFKPNAAQKCVYTKYLSTFINCEFIGGNIGIEKVSSYPLTVINCTFYNQTSACIKMSLSLLGGLVEYNNIYCVAVPANDYAIEMDVVSGSICYSDYSATNSTIIGTWGKTGPGQDPLPKPPNAIEEFVAANNFVDPNNDDFRLKPGSVCLNVGKPTIGSNINSNNGLTSMGAWLRKSFLRIE